MQQLVSRSTSGESGKATPVAQSTVEHLARLTHLPLSPTEVDAVRREIEGLLHFVAIVQVRTQPLRRFGFRCLGLMG